MLPLKIKKAPQNHPPPFPTFLFLSNSIYSHFNHSIILFQLNLVEADSVRRESGLKTAQFFWQLELRGAAKHITCCEYKCASFRDICITTRKSCCCVFFLSFMLILLFLFPSLFLFSLLFFLIRQKCLNKPGIP